MSKLRHFAGWVPLTEIISSTHVTAADLFLEEVVAEYCQLLDGLDEVVENFLVAVDDVLHLLWSRHLTCTTTTL